MGLALRVAAFRPKCGFLEDELQGTLGISPVGLYG